MSPQRDYVVHVAETPRFEPPDCVEGVDLDGGGAETRTTMKTSVSKNSISGGEALDSVDEKRVTNHARQVR